MASHTGPLCARGNFRQCFRGFTRARGFIGGILRPDKAEPGPPVPGGGYPLPYTATTRDGKMGTVNRSEGAYGL